MSARSILRSICVVVPHADYLECAGTRIRYRRMAAALARRGIRLDIRPADEVMRVCADLGHDVFLISKVYDPRALKLVVIAKASKRLVGVDLFDDFFSEDTDARLALRRSWLGEMAAHCDFALVSTPAIWAALDDPLSALPVHLMNDPAPPPEASLGPMLARKRRFAVERRELRIAWFGMGDNEFFDVGLHDVAAYAERLRALSAHDYRIRLRVLTNARAMTPDALARLNRTGLYIHVETWSEAREDAVLSDCVGAFLPVNGQPFSRAKSLNRALTALHYGAQILSAGHPLYARLYPFVYRDFGAFVGDLEADRLRLRADTIDQLGIVTASVADADAEAARLKHFLVGLMRAADTPPLAMQGALR